MQFRRRTGASDELLKLVKFMGARLVGLATKVSNRGKITERNLILLESFLGARLDCNPKAIFDYLRREFPEKYKYVWVAQEPRKWEELAVLPDVEVVAHRSREHQNYANIAGVVITNSPRSNELPSRKEQLQIQTWHGGGCYKKVGTAVNKHMPVSRYITRRQFNRFNYFISSSSFFTAEVVRNQYVYSGDVLECGMPRNDRLVTNNVGEREEIRKALGIQNGSLLVLFAPTWRDYSGEAPQFEVCQIREAVAERTSCDVVMGVRGHYFSEYGSESFDANFDDYKDMQGLLLATDVLITDYSSVIWDYSFTYRPCFLYTPDLAQYEQDRGFDVDIHEWGFPVCETTEELVKAIKAFDPVQFRRQMELHHERLGSFETGRACEAVAKVIEEHCFGKGVSQK